MKHLIKSTLLVLGLLLMVFACQKDDVNTENQQQTIATVSYKKLALDDIEKLKPVVNNIKKIVPKIPVGMQARDFSFLSLDSLDIENIIEYTDTTGYSTWTFKMNGIDNSNNFENLHLLETDDGYIGYILSYEPDETWFYSDENLTPEGDRVLHMDDYHGYITKYSLERELIWSSNPATQNASNRKTYNSHDRNGGTTICTISAIQSCSNPNIPDPTHPAGPNCQGPFGVMEQETCVTYSGGGGDTSNNGGSSSSNDDDCDGSGGTSGTLIQGTQPISGVNGGCAPNETIGVLPDGDVIIECNVSPAVQTSVFNCLFENSFEMPEVQNLLTSPENSCALNTIASIMNENGCTEARLILIELLLEWDPYFLVDINCDEIQNWQALAQHTAPQNVQMKIENLPSSLTNDFEIQTLTDANGTMVNLDYFSVKINTLPNKPGITPIEQYTADELIDFIRRNFNDFVVGSTFEPYCEIPSMCQTETDLWNSDNPLGSIIYIDIPLDDGVVVCTEYTNSYWYFMTMNAPYAGNHPVSGTRQFGYELNNDGSYNFFVRGVDRMDSNTMENIAFITTAGSPFNGADDLWESFQTKTNEFVNINGGNSTIVTPIKNRPDWTEVEQVLNGELPLSELGCN